MIYIYIYYLYNNLAFNIELLTGPVSLSKLRICLLLKDLL